MIDPKLRRFFFFFETLLLQRFVLHKFSVMEGQGYLIAFCAFQVGVQNARYVRNAHA